MTILRCFSVLSLAALAGCANTVSETRSDFVYNGETFDIYNGETYELRTRTIERSGETFEHSAVRVFGMYYTCLPDSPGSCEAAVRRGVESIDRS